MDGHDIFPDPYEWCMIIVNIIVFLIATTGMLMLRYVVGRFLRTFSFHTPLINNEYFKKYEIF